MCKMSDIANILYPFKSSTIIRHNNLNNSNGSSMETLILRQILHAGIIPGFLSKLVSFWQSGRVHTYFCFKLQVMVYLILSPCATGLCTVGVVITGIYGLCQSDKCSYVINTDFNMGMATFFLVLELLCLISTILSVLSSVYFAHCFTIYTCFHTRPVPGSIQVKPATDEVQLAQDMAALQMWRHRIEGDVDFSKVADHLERTRKKRLEEVQETEQ